MRAAVDTRRLTVLVPPYAEAVAVRRRRTLPGVQALVDQRAVPLDEQFLELDRGSGIGQPATHRYSLRSSTSVAAAVSAAVVMTSGPPAQAVRWREGTTRRQDRVPPRRRGRPSRGRTGLS